MFDIEKAKNFKIADENVIKALKKRIKKKYDFGLEKGDIYDLEFMANNVVYALEQNNETEWLNSNDNTEIQTIDYQLITYDTDFGDIIDKFNIIISQEIQRTGTHSDEYNDLYCFPTISKIISIKNIPEEIKIIPAHEEILLEVI